MEGAMFVEKLWKLWSDDFSINLNLGESKATFGLRWLGQDDCYFVLTTGAGTFSGLSFPRLPGDLSDHVAVGGAVQADRSWFGDWCRNTINELRLFACSSRISSGRLCRSGLSARGRGALVFKGRSIVDLDIRVDLSWRGACNDRESSGGSKAQGGDTGKLLHGNLSQVRVKLAGNSD